MEAWSGISLTAVADTTGDLQQIYPSWAPAGIAPASATNGQQIKGPSEGIMYSLQVETDGTNGGIIQIYDLNGLDIGADVSSATAITAAQLASLVTLGRAKLIYEQNFAATGVTPPTTSYRTFQHGIAARFISSAGACKLNLVVQGGFRLTTKVG